MAVERIDNDTDLVAYTEVVLTRGGDRLLTVLKGTFALRAGATVLEPLPRERGRPIRLAEEPWGDPLTTPPKYPADTAPCKPASDVVVVASGHAPGGTPVPWFDVGLRVGSAHKELRLFGLRVWQQGGAGLSAPRPLVEQPIRYDAAWGGWDLSDTTQPVGDLRNPVGRGVVRDRSALGDRLAPCIEDPASLIHSAASNPPPAGFGPLGPHWFSRRSSVGTYDAAWLRSQAPLPPVDQEDRHHQCASPGLVVDPPLGGGEPVELRHLTPGGGVVAFALPATRPRLQHELRGELLPPLEPHLDTVVLDTLHVPEGVSVVVELVWRTLTPMPRRPRDGALSVTAV
jgi:hypothetical protein